MGFVYLFRNRDTNQYKIGFTKRNPKERLKESETFNANDLVIVDFFESVYAKQIEKGLHNRYKSFHINREWFNLNYESVLSFKKSCKSIETALIAVNEVVE